MRLRYVRMREPGEAPGLTAKRHGVRHWNFQSGVSPSQVVKVLP